MNFVKRFKDAEGRPLRLDQEFNTMLGDFIWLMDKLKPLAEWKGREGVVARVEAMEAKYGIECDETVELPPEPANANKSLDEAIKTHVLKVVRGNQGKLAISAKELGVTYITLHRWISKWGFEVEKHHGTCDINGIGRLQ